MYADDTTLSLQHKNLSQAMQIMNPELEKTTLLFDRNQLTLNVLKTLYVVFHKARIFPPNTIESLLIGGSHIERVFEFRYLGVKLDPCLNLNLHIQDVVKKCQNLFPSFQNNKCFK